MNVASEIGTTPSWRRDLMTDSDTVTFANNLPALPERLLLARDRGEVLFVAGAGISRSPPSCLPGFRELVVEVYDQLDSALANKMRAMIDQEVGGPSQAWRNYAAELNATQQAELRAMARDEYDVVLGMLERRLNESTGNESALRRTVREILSRTQQPNVMHTSLVQLGQRFGQIFIATTNFDILLEKAAAGRRTPTAVYSLGSMPRPSRRQEFAGIFHLHGRLGNELPLSDLVLTDQDFGDAYLRRRIAGEFIYDAARIFQIVLVGYSLSDAPMRYLMNAIAGDESHFQDIKPRYAIIPVNEDRAVDIAYWRGRGIEPIAYDPHNDHAQLRELLGQWVRSIPSTSGDKWSRQQIRRITRGAIENAPEADQSLFRYIMRRSRPSEREGLISHFGRPSAGWFQLLNDISRQDALGR